MRLIDADELLKAPFRIEGKFGGKYPFEAITIKMIEAAPTVEAAPVVHGKWKTIRGNFITGGGNPMWGCSKCGSLIGASLLPPKDNYCPNCAAKMDL